MLEMMQFASHYLHGFQTGGITGTVYNFYANLNGLAFSPSLQAREWKFIPSDPLTKSMKEYCGE
jgi:hypothetical protein